jgi:hypothetical protein
MKNKKCSYCGLLKSLSDFNNLKSSKDGYDYSCRECRKKIVKKTHIKNKKNNKNIVVDINKKKFCSYCKKLKNVDNFGVSIRNSDGLNCYCKDCRKIRSQVYREKYYDREK